MLSQVPKSAQPWVATLLRTVFEQPDAEAVKARMRHVLDALETKFPKAAEHLDAAQHDLWPSPQGRRPGHHPSDVPDGALYLPIAPNQPARAALAGVVDSAAALATERPLVRSRAVRGADL
ncbi:transposase [Streptomyces sp. NPDC007905]|uniref:transposase n=1 Tax=Streptomyces sp. NPDC007905 TaxID=3364788 RepID=UPI0036EEFCD0